MHLVFVSSLVPVADPSSGFDIANRAMLDGLRSLGHKVSVLGYLQPGQTPAPGGCMHLLGQREVANSRVGAVTKLRWLVRAFAYRTTLSSAKLLDVSARDMRRRLDALGPFDAVVLNSVQLPGAFADLFEAYPTIYVAHNAEAASARESAAAASGMVERLLFEREARHLDHIEGRLAGNARWVWTFCEHDRFAFGAAVAERASALPLVRQWAEPKTEGQTMPAVRDIGLIGTWSWKPNCIGLDWFLGDVVPRLPSDMTIEIAGDVPNMQVAAHPGLRFLGRVADAASFVSSSRVVPLVSRGGTGVQLKTIETFESGIPSVATPSSLRGIDQVPVNCLQADDAAAFAAALCSHVAGVRDGTVRTLSGRPFHAAQKEALVEALGSSLSVLAHPPAVRLSPLRRMGIQPVRLDVPQGGLSR